MVIAHINIELFHNPTKYNNNDNINNSYDIRKFRKDAATCHKIFSETSADFINNTLRSKNLNLQEKWGHLNNNIILNCVAYFKKTLITKNNNTLKQKIYQQQLKHLSLNKDTKSIDGNLYICKACINALKKNIIPSYNEKILINN